MNHCFAHGKVIDRSSLHLGIFVADVIRIAALGFKNQRIARGFTCLSRRDLVEPAYDPKIGRRGAMHSRYRHGNFRSFPIAEKLCQANSRYFMEQVAARRITRKNTDVGGVAK